MKLLALLLLAAGCAVAPEDCWVPAYHYDMAGYRTLSQGYDDLCWRWTAPGGMEQVASTEHDTCFDKEAGKTCLILPYNAPEVHVYMAGKHDRYQVHDPALELVTCDTRCP